MCTCQLKCVPNIVISESLKKHPFLYSWDGREDILILAIRYSISVRFFFVVVVIRWDNKESMETLILFMTLNSLNSHCGPAVN